MGGFTDGDGCISIPSIAVSRPSQIRLSWYQAKKDEFIIDEIKEFLIAHKISCNSYVTKVGTGGKQLWVTGQASNLRVLKRLAPHLIIKREKALEAIEILNTRPTKAWVEERRRRAFA